MRGMGRVFRKKFRRPNGAWYEGKVWWIAYPYRGKEQKESSGSERESDARRLLKKRLGEIGRGQLIGRVEERVTFEQLAEDLVRDYEINGLRSVRSVKLSVAHLRAFFGFDKALDITTDRINSYVALRQGEIAELHQQRAARKTKQATGLRDKAKSLQDSDEKRRLVGEANWLDKEAERLGTISNASINRELAALKRMFTLAKRAKKIASPPYIPTLEENNARQGFVNYDLFLSLRDNLGIYKDPIAFLYLSGWRSGEMKKVERRDVDRAARFVRLRPELAKNKKGRVLPLTGELLDIVDRALANARPDCPLLFHIKGRPLGDIRKTWRKACIESGLCGVVPHDFRRSAVRNLTRAGIPEKVAMTLTGHKTRSVFDRYNIVSEKDLAQAADQLESYLRNQPTTSTVRPMRVAANSPENSDTIRTQGPSVGTSVVSKSLKDLEPSAGVEPANI